MRSSTMVSVDSSCSNQCFDEAVMRDFARAKSSRRAVAKPIRMICRRWKPAGVILTYHRITDLDDDVNAELPPSDKRYCVPLKTALDCYRFSQRAH